MIDKMDWTFLIVGILIIILNIVFIAIDYRTYKNFKKANIKKSVKLEIVMSILQIIAGISSIIMSVNNLMVLYFSWLLFTCEILTIVLYLINTFKK